ncbi:MAG: class I SAM-dependent methyltransferase [Microlunatus sp.]|nr:class I SAM-dependent methyltransferase [Microlunatus sp.]MDN5770951.1 class I SAM-dependent methyltransferase [Microlunatus sp.]MDN5804098.1 class I SAM-dependent methyltransferase [Microlunatus sp.]
MSGPASDQTSATEHRFYGDFAPWWPLISPPEEYAEEASFAATLLAAGGATSTVLELGSGGGHLASHLADRFELTLVDLSEPMLTVSRALNPRATHHQGDMRTVRLDQQFDAVFIHDAIDYMTTEDDLRLAIETAYAHCRPGGIAVLVPDDVTESFVERTIYGGSDALDGRAARYLEWSWDPDPHDSWTITIYTFVLREANGAVETSHETHRFGLFSRDVWLALLSETGFSASAHAELPTGEDHPRTWFVGRRDR